MTVLRVQVGRELSLARGGAMEKLAAGARRRQASNADCRIFLEAAERGEISRIFMEDAVPRSGEVLKPGAYHGPTT